jgi:hypothetical protein
MLLLQARQASCHIRQGDAQLSPSASRRELADHGFTGLVNHPVEQLGAHPYAGVGSLPQSCMTMACGRGICSPTERWHCVTSVDGGA